MPSLVSKETDKRPSLDALFILIFSLTMISWELPSVYA